MATENQHEHNPWKWGLFYYDTSDPRILIPRPIATYGWTINFANKISWAIGAGTVLLIVWAIYSGQARVNMP